MGGGENEKRENRESRTYKSLEEESLHRLDQISGKKKGPTKMEVQKK